ncbi:Acg family FMN-binding oxidoreductase [Planosporangium sp. 12N6]|uniref:Acg family FMN-binding oxidoreductase n=1 Tax=Planosporangium spinosum TaxID=3402278 RepID=UPI003CF51DE4
MAMIQFTEPIAARQGRPATRALTQAAVAAGRAPSIFNSQPWRWRIADDAADLRADRQRQLRTADPDGRLLTISCGAALHHAGVTLAGGGFATEVARLPDAGDPDLLARIRVTGTTGPPRRQAVRLQLAMALRHTDRRPFADVEVPAAALDRLCVAADDHGAHLRLLHPEEVVTLAVAAARAGETERADPRYRAELAAWTGRCGDSSDGIRPATAARHEQRPVPLRDLDPGGLPSAETSELVDRHARYGILYSDGDTPLCWMTAGEALSAVLLTATAERLAASPISEVIEVPAARALLRDLLGGAGYPMVALRFGVPADGPLATAARRASAEVVERSG